MPKKETSNYSVGYQAYLMPYNKLTNEQRAKVPYINIERGGQPNSDMSNVLVYTDRFGNPFTERQINQGINGLPIMYQNADGTVTTMTPQQLEDFVTIAYSPKKSMVDTSLDYSGYLANELMGNHNGNRVKLMQKVYKDPVYKKQYEDAREVQDNAATALATFAAGAPLAQGLESFLSMPFWQQALTLAGSYAGHEAGDEAIRAMSDYNGYADMMKTKTHAPIWFSETWNPFTAAGGWTSNAAYYGATNPQGPRMTITPEGVQLVNDGDILYNFGRPVSGGNIPAQNGYYYGRYGYTTPHGTSRGTNGHRFSSGGSKSNTGKSSSANSRNVSDVRTVNGKPTEVYAAQSPTVPFNWAYIPMPTIHSPYVPIKPPVEPPVAEPFYYEQYVPTEGDPYFDWWAKAYKRNPGGLEEWKGAKNSAFKPGWRLMILGGKDPDTYRRDVGNEQGYIYKDSTTNHVGNMQFQTNKLEGDVDPNAELLDEKLIGFKNGGNIKRRFK